VFWCQGWRAESIYKCASCAALSGWLQSEKAATESRSRGAQFTKIDAVLKGPPIVRQYSKVRADLLVRWASTLKVSTVGAAAMPLQSRFVISRVLGDRPRLNLSEVRTTRRRSQARFRSAKPQIAYDGVSAAKIADAGSCAHARSSQKPFSRSRDSALGYAQVWRPATRENGCAANASERIAQSCGTIRIATLTPMTMTKNQMINPKFFFVSSAAGVNALKREHQKQTTQNT